MSVASVEQSAPGRQRHHHHRLEDLHNFLSPMSYSRSTTGAPSSSTSYQHRNSTSTTTMVPPPPSIQKSVLVEGMANLFDDNHMDAELSRLLSLSGGGTPRDILSNHSISTQQRKEELQEVLEYIDGMTFVTPYKSNSRHAHHLISLQSPMPSLRKTDSKPPRPSSVLADRSNKTVLANAHSTTPWKPSSNSARDPTPTKPKPVALDLLREINPAARSSPSLQSMMMMLMSPSPVDQSSLLVEVSHSTAASVTDEDDCHENQNPDTGSKTHGDPPVDDSKYSDVWSSPPRVGMDPEPSQSTPPTRRGGAGAGADTSILLGTAFADWDLRPRTHTAPTLRPTPLRTSWATPVQENFKEASYLESQEAYITEVEHGFVTAQNEGTTTSSFGVQPLDLPSTPGLALVDDAKLEELQARLPQSPRDAKEWLQTAVLALQNARAERDLARKWARDMKDAVSKWAEEQRKLIRCETSTRIDALEEREQHLRMQTEALTQLQVLVQQLHQEFHSTQSERQASELQIQKLILDQQERIHTLSQQVTSMEQTVTEGMSQANQLTPKSEVSSGNAANAHAFPRFIDRPATTTNSSSHKSTRSTSSSRVRKPLPGGNGFVTVYSNGVEKEVHNDGTTVIRYTNGDVETDFGTTIAYFHASEQVLQVSNSQDGSTLLEYPNGQIERHYANGVKAILFPDGTKAKISADGKVETYHRA